MRIGWVIDPWIGGSLRIFWNPAANRVQVDRPPQWRKIPMPSGEKSSSPVRLPKRTISAVAVITVRDDTTVILEVRPQYGPDRSVTAHHMRVVIPLPHDNEYFLGAMEVAARTYNTLQLPADFWEQRLSERKAILVKAAHELPMRNTQLREQ